MKPAPKRFSGRLSGFQAQLRAVWPPFEAQMRAKLESEGWRQEIPGVWFKRDPETGEIVGIAQD